MQGRVHREHRRDVGAVDVHLVGHGEVGQLLQPHEGAGRFARGQLAAAGRLEEHRFDLPPGRLVADPDFRVEDQTLRLDERAVVDDVTRQDLRVRDDDLLVLERLEVRDLQPHLDHVAHGVADLHAVADLEGAAVGHHVAGDDVRDRGRGSQREDDADEERDALERVRLGTRDVGIGDDQPERDDGDPGDLVGRLRPVRVEVGELHRAAADRLEEQADEPEHQSNDEEEHQPGRRGWGRSGRCRCRSRRAARARSRRCRGTGRASRATPRAGSRGRPGSRRG